MKNIIKLPKFDMPALGVCIFLDLEGCNREILEDGKRIEDIMLEAARIAKATIIGRIFHNFNPHGTSGVVVIAESHLAIHTWPEYGVASIDIYTCGDLGCDLAANYLVDVLCAEKYDICVKPRLLSKNLRPHKINS